MTKADSYPARPSAASAAASSGACSRWRRARWAIACTRSIRRRTVPPARFPTANSTCPSPTFATLTEFARGVDVVTYEFENIPVEALDALAPKACCCGRAATSFTPRRIGCAKRNFSRQNGFPIAPFRVVQSEAELREAVVALGLPLRVLKTADFGYDGKGSRRSITRPI